MSYGRALQVWQILSLLLAGVYAIAAIIGLLADFDSAADTVIWVAFLGGGATLIMLGLYAVRSRGWLSSGLVSAGVAAGALPLFWVVVVPLAAAVVIALGFAIARRPAPAA